MTGSMATFTETVMGFLPAFEGDSPIIQSVGYWVTKAYGEKDFILMHLHLIASAVFPIYIGSFASLRCPPSAEEKSKKKKNTQDPASDDDEDDEDELEEHTKFEGLTPSDAIMFPIMAACVLAGLYFLIKWLKDPAMLNRILGYYFSALGIFGIAMLTGDSLNVATSFVFPKAWASGGKLFYVDSLLKQQVTDVSSTDVDSGALVHRKFTDKKSPFPGALSRLNLSDKWSNRVWSVRSLLVDHWILRTYFHGVVSAKTKINLNNVVGLVLGVAAIALYNFNGKAWWLSNLMGWGFCYNSLQLMSPTTFWTGSLVLAGLFVYDIVMVFYTPLMITVATKLDVPIKLSIPGPGNGTMLGLGDILLPGIMMALALRFDLYMFYLRQAKGPTSASSSSNVRAVADGANSKLTKPTYIPTGGTWGTTFWTASIPKEKLPTTLKASSFPKPYFWASIVGYVFGMCVTLVVLTLFKHGQPALLYLVPGVLGSLWGTAWVRGELSEMWNYTEAGDEIDEVEDKPEGKKDGPRANESTESGDKKLEEAKKEKVGEHAHHVFLFSLSFPRHNQRKRKSVLASSHK